MEGFDSQSTGSRTASRLSVQVERWPIRGRFTTSQGSKREAIVVIATISDGTHKGRGECVPSRRYGESVKGVMAAIEACAERVAGGLSREELSGLLPAGAARNALDCALWDLEAKKRRQCVAALTGLFPLHPVPTTFTISLASPGVMACQALAASATYPQLKLKLGGAEDQQRLSAVREVVPNARLIVDANEAWQPQDLETLLDAARAAGVELIEQPLPASKDDMLGRITRPVPVCADESVHDVASLERSLGRYDAVNIKLDKTGGLSEALLVAKRAREFDLKIMVGCMPATSLSMAPAVLVAQDADWVDLDGPLLLARDRVPGLTYSSGMILPPSPELWGGVG